VGSSQNLHGTGPATNILAPSMSEPRAGGKPSTTSFRFRGSASSRPPTRRSSCRSCRRPSSAVTALLANPSAHDNAC